LPKSINSKVKRPIREIRKAGLENAMKFEFFILDHFAGSLLASRE
jgi:hypothetical protein